VPTTERSINDVIALVLRERRRLWALPQRVRSENTRIFRDAGLQPDILITEAGTSPVVVETEVMPAATVEADARSRLGQALRDSGRQVFSTIAVRLPLALRDHEGTALADALRDGAIRLEFTCFTGRSPTDAVRWPQAGWISGSMADLCLVCQSMTIPPPIVDDASNRLVQGVSDAAGILTDLAQEYRTALDAIAALLHQEERIQTRRMAMTIIANAFVFHASLVGHGGPLAEIRSVHQIRAAEGRLSRDALLQEWRKILLINYWPIFDIARQVVEFLPAPTVAEILDGLARTADSVLESGLTQSHDLVGAIFQRLIADRKFLAAFYTRPASAALLAGLAISPARTPHGEEWGDPANMTRLRVADFACGTGTLLSTVYQVIRQYHELHGGDEEQLHPDMMAHVLTGCDIMPAGTHVTASMLSGAHPAAQYPSSSIMTMPFGRQGGRALSLGSLDLLQREGVFPVFATSASIIEGSGLRRAEAWHRIPDRTYDLVIMNPPFVRPTNHEGKHGNVPNPMFAAFYTTAKQQRQMSERLTKIAHDTAYHGNAGEASAFLALAHRKITSRGTLALVMPLTLLFGGSWEASRKLLRRHYTNLCVVSIAAARAAALSFSADTDMAECLVVGERSHEGDGRATFVMLASKPAVPLEGATIARIVREQRATARQLEDGPVGGTPIRVGDDLVGTMLNAPVPVDGPWPLSRVLDAAVAQTAYQLERGHLWLPGEVAPMALPMSRLADVGNVGPLHRDINGIEGGGKVLRGPFDIADLSPNEEPTYPALWSHDADRERCLVVGPDSQGIVRQGRSSAEETAVREKAARIWATASRCHFNYDFQFNSQSTAAVLTERPAIGGRAWPSITFRNEAYEAAFVLWANSTLGLLMHWWCAGKQQSGRGSITLSRLPELPIYDLRTLSGDALLLAARYLEELSGTQLLRFDQIDGDTQRHRIDALVGQIFGIPERLLAAGGAFDLLRRKLAHEPSITGGRERG
jgi:hypothetical protein